MLKVNKSSHADVKTAARFRRRCLRRVCQAWHVTSWVQVPWPGLRRAEGKEKGKGIVARRGLEEAQSEAAGR